MRRTLIRHSLAVVVGVGVLLTAQQTFAEARPEQHRPAVPALPPCDAFSTPPPGSVTVFIPPLPGRNCLPPGAKER